MISVQEKVHQEVMEENDGETEPGLSFHVHSHAPGCIVGLLIYPFSWGYAKLSSLCPPPPSSFITLLIDVLYSYFSLKMSIPLQHIHSFLIHVSLFQEALLYLHFMSLPPDLGL